MNRLLAVWLLVGCVWPISNSTAALTITFQQDGDGDNYLAVRATIIGTVDSDFGPKVTHPTYSHGPFGFIYQHNSGFSTEFGYVPDEDEYGILGAGDFVPFFIGPPNGLARQASSYISDSSDDSLAVSISYGNGIFPGQFQNTNTVAAWVTVRTPPNKTSFNASIIWNGMRLSEMFTEDDIGRSYCVLIHPDSSTPLVTLNIVPEPSSLSLLALGGVVVALRRRR